MVPVLINAGPVEGIVMCDFVVRVEVKPAPAAFIFRPAVPGYAQGLQPPAGKLDKILLERIDTERIFDFVVMKLRRGRPCVP